MTPEKHRLEFKAKNGYPSACNLTIYRSIGLVIATEINEGQSLTNACDLIATLVVNQFGIDPKRLMFIEHYPAEQRPTYGESYDLVTFQWDGKEFSNPEWKPLTVTEFDEIIGTL